MARCLILVSAFVSSFAVARPGDRGDAIRIPAAPFVHATSTRGRTATVTDALDCPTRFMRTGPKVEYTIEAPAPGVLSAYVDGDGVPAMVDVVLLSGSARDGTCLAHGNKQASATVRAGTHSILIGTPDAADGANYRLRVDLQPADGWYARPVARGVKLSTRIYANLNGARESGGVIEVDLSDPDVQVKPLVRQGMCAKTSALGKEAHAVAAINGGFFENTNCTSVSLLKIDGNVITRNTSRRSAFGINGSKQPIIAAVAAGQDWPDAVQAVGGVPRIATGGRVDLHTVEEGLTPAFEQGRNPRTAVGITADGKVLFGVVNGRTSAGAGMSLRELSTWMTGLGVQDAVNFDGGGSSTLWVSNEPGSGIVNRPSDPGGERAVSSALGVFARPLDRPAIWLTRPAPARVMVGDEWSFEAVVADPEARSISFRVDRMSVDGMLSVLDRTDGTGRFSFRPSARDVDRSPITLTLYADVQTGSTSTVAAMITVVSPPPPADSGVRGDGSVGPGSDGGSGGPGPGENPGQGGGGGGKSGCSCSTGQDGARQSGGAMPIGLMLIGVIMLRRSRERRARAVRYFASAILALVLLLTGAPAVFAQDPAAMGSLSVATETYDFGNFMPPGYPHQIELRGQIKYPEGLPGGPYPVTLLLHGRHATCYQGAMAFQEWPCTGAHQPIESFKGYDYLGDILASNGVITISVSVNGINAYDNSLQDSGMAFRAETLQRHLDQWRMWSTSGGYPMGDPNKFVGKVDLMRVATMGHSRGGEGVVTHYNLNRSRGSPYGILGVIPLAPVNFFRPNTGDAALMVVAPGCDGDVSDLQGVHYFDDVRYNGATRPRYTIHVLGGNHNYFNTIWTDGIGPSMDATDDWLYTPGLQMDPYCSFTQAGNGRLSSAQQRAVGAAYMAAFFRTVINGEDFSGFLTGDAGIPPSANFFNRPIYAWYHAPDSKRRDIDRLVSMNDLSVNYLGGMVTGNNLNPNDVCGGDAPQQRFCLVKPPGFSDAQYYTWQPHQTPSANAQTVRGLAMNRVGWSNAGAARITNAIPSAYQDVSGFDSLQFRAAVNFQSQANTRNGLQDMTVTLEDGTNSASTTVTLASSSGILYYPPGGFFPHLLFNTVRIPLINFAGVDLTHIQSVRFDYDQSMSGAVMLSDIAFASAP